MMGRPAPPCSTRPPRIQGRPASAGRRRDGLVADDHVVVDVGHRPAPLGVGAEGHGAGHDGLEVGHQVAAEQRDGRRPDRSSRRGVSMAPAATTTWRAARNRLDAVGPDQVDAGGPAALDADPGHEGLGQQLGPAGGHGPHAAWRSGRPWRGWGSRSRRRSRSCCRPACRRRGRCWPRWAPGRGGSRAVRRRPPDTGGAEHGRARGHREGSRPGRGEGIGPLGAGHADGPLDLGVVRLELVVVDRPVGHVGVGLGAETEWSRRKSSGRKRGTLPSAWVPPPPTVVGTELTSPTWVRSPSSSWVRKVRGSTSGSGPRKCRLRNLISSLE